MRFRVFNRMPAVVVVMALMIVTVGAAPAGANESKIKYYGYKPFCSNDGTSIQIGGNVFQKELGKSGVRQFRVKWLVYRTNVTEGFNPSYARKTIKSTRFPNNATSHWWDGATGHNTAGGVGNFHRFRNLPATNSYKLVAKLTWDRPNRPDWNRKILVAYCE